jgi:hypothetical protein
MRGSRGRLRAHPSTVATRPSFGTGAPVRAFESVDLGLAAIDARPPVTAGPPLTRRLPLVVEGVLRDSLAEQRCALARFSFGNSLLDADLVVLALRPPPRPGGR